MSTVVGVDRRGRSRIRDKLNFSGAVGLAEALKEARITALHYSSNARGACLRRHWHTLRSASRMAEPIPSASTTADAADEENQPVANNAEDRKAAAALNNLNTQEISHDGEGAPKQRSAADQEALSKAISQLEIASGGAKKTEASKKVEEKKKEAEVKKKIKVSQEDVTFLVEELDLTKVKATELLRSHDGDAMTAIKAFITPAVKA